MIVPSFPYWGGLSMIIQPGVENAAQVSPGGEVFTQRDHDVSERRLLRKHFLRDIYAT